VLGRVSEEATGLSSYRYSTTDAENYGGRTFPNPPAAGSGRMVNVLDLAHGSRLYARPR
jgi:hypothetical protein